MTSIPQSIRGIDFCDCLASTLGWLAQELLHATSDDASERDLSETPAKSEGDPSDITDTIRCDASENSEISPSDIAEISPSETTGNGHDVTSSGEVISSTGKGTTSNPQPPTLKSKPSNPDPKP